MGQCEDKGDSHHHFAGNIHASEAECGVGTKEPSDLRREVNSVRVGFKKENKLFCNIGELHILRIR